MPLLRLYANCVIVKGASRAVIYDLQRKCYFLIPMEFANLFENGCELHYEEIAALLDEEDAVIFAEYLQLLQEHELAFSCTAEELMHFPGLPLLWDFPAQVSHCIIDLNKEEAWVNEKLMQQLAVLGCNYIELRFYKNVSRSYLEHVSTLVAAAQVKSIDLLVKDEGTADFYGYLGQLADGNRKIRNITIHHALADAQVKQANEGFGAILTVREQICSSMHCGVIHHVYFSVNVETFTESLRYNSCLNRKISIDADGFIKNCPSMKENFGHISSTRLEDAAAHPGFHKIGSIAKDEIAVCRDCEFRYICTDCRAYIEEPGDVYSKPLKCGYDPYTCTWEEWSTHSLKQQAIEHYGMHSLI